MGSEPGDKISSPLTLGRSAEPLLNTTAMCPFASAVAGKSLINSSVRHPGSRKDIEAGQHGNAVDRHVELAFLGGSPKSLGKMQSHRIARAGSESRERISETASKAISLIHAHGGRIGHSSRSNRRSRRRGTAGVKKLVRREWGDSRCRSGVHLIDRNHCRGWRLRCRGRFIRLTRHACAVDCRYCVVVSGASHNSRINEGRCGDASGDRCRRLCSGRSAAIYVVRRCSGTRAPFERHLARSGSRCESCGHRRNGDSGYGRCRNFGRLSGGGGSGYGLDRIEVGDSISQADVGKGCGGNVRRNGRGSLSVGACAAKHVIGDRARGGRPVENYLPVARSGGEPRGRLQRGSRSGPGGVYDFNAADFGLVCSAGCKRENDAAGSSGVRSCRNDKGNVLSACGGRQYRSW